MKREQNNIRGCLIGGAIGDALGWPVEFLRYNEIINKFGLAGIQDLICNTSGVAEFTDDTQLTLFTAEGILRADTRKHEKGICYSPSVVFFAYQRWLLIQGYPKVEEFEDIYDGLLLNVKDLHVRRAPGNACISALYSHKQGSKDQPINNSKGCGGVMRVAPVGLFYGREDAFNVAVDLAALTHGHPSGYLSAGALAFIIASIIEGQSLGTAIRNTISELESRQNHTECSLLLRKAVELADSVTPDLQAITQLGEGWVGEEALAISVYCTMKHPDDFRQALIAAVNHDGDSDSTGAITGNILGACLGLDNIPAEWVQKVEMKGILMLVADDLLSGFQDSSDWRNNYPGH